MLSSKKQRNAHYAADERAPVIGDEPNGENRMVKRKRGDKEYGEREEKIEKPNLSGDWATVRLDRDDGLGMRFSRA